MNDITLKNKGKNKTINNIKNNSAKNKVRVETFEEGDLFAHKLISTGFDFKAHSQLTNSHQLKGALTSVVFSPAFIQAIRQMVSIKGVQFARSWLKRKGYNSKVIMTILNLVERGMRARKSMIGNSKETKFPTHFLPRLKNHAPPANTELVSASLIQKTLGSSQGINDSRGSSWHGPEINSRTINGMLTTSVKGKDYLGLITGGTGYQVVSFRIQPGLPGVFPWLSKSAAAYEQYRFRKARLVIETLCPTTVAGEVMMYADYDSHDPVPNDARDFFENSASKSAPVWQTAFTYELDERSMNEVRMHYVRTGAIPENADIQLYDCGVIHLAYDNLDASLDGIAISRVFLEYECEFFIPHTDSLEEAQQNFNLFVTLSCTISQPFLNMVKDVSDTNYDSGALGVTFTNTGSNIGKINFPFAGYYFLSIWCLGTGSPLITVQTADGGCTYEQILGTSSTTIQLINVLVRALEPGAWINCVYTGSTVTQGKISCCFKATGLSHTYEVPSDIPDFPKIAHHSNGKFKLREIDNSSSPQVSDTDERNYDNSRFNRNSAN
jgi:hypothetical protein